jgi:hypothetical protein
MLVEGYGIVEGTRVERVPLHPLKMIQENECRNEEQNNQEETR